MNFNATYQYHVSEPSKSNWTYWYKNPSKPKWLVGSFSSMFGPEGKARPKPKE